MGKTYVASAGSITEQPDAFLVHSRALRPLRISSACISFRHETFPLAVQHRAAER
jgi:hypothetical protein